LILEESHHRLVPFTPPKPSDLRELFVPNPNTVSLDRDWKLEIKLLNVANPSLGQPD
jgi:hypothetical protein